MKPWAWALVFALLGAATLGAGATPAWARGCHAEERAAIGLSFPTDTDFRTAEPAPPGPSSRHATRVTRPPCSGQTPVTVASETLPQVALEAAPDSIAPAPGRFAQVTSAPPLHTRLAPARLDRPPRP